LSRHQEFVHATLGRLILREFSLFAGQGDDSQVAFVFESCGRRPDASSHRDA
jgi:hypothetical protein